MPTPPLLVILNTHVRETHGLLAHAALAQAAQTHNLLLRVETHTSTGVQEALTAAELAAATQVLHIGQTPPADDSRLHGKTVIHAGIDDVLRDAQAVLLRTTPGHHRAQLANTPVAAATAPTATTSTSAPGTPTGLRIVAITSCPTGIAHTFMAEEGLKTAAAALGHSIKVETQGSVGAQNALTAQDIAEADLVIIAADTQVNTSRFGGKRLFSSGTKAAIKDGQSLIAQAWQQATVHGTDRTAAPAQTTAGQTANTARQERTGIYKHLMTGVSFMLPFVVTGGLLIALGFALGGIYVYEDQYQGSLGWTLFTVGKQAFSLMIPVLSGYIAYSIADRPGITPGMAAGLVASNIGAGFLGGLVSGFMAGYTAKWLNEKIQLGRNLDGLKPVLILPLLSTAIVGLLMYYVIGQPVASALAALTEWLKGMQTGSALALGMLLAGMMAVDMGGPINKAAYTFGTGLLASEVYAPMAAVMAGGMTPPLAIALAAWLFKNRFTPEERDGAKAAGIMGLAFITEGAIPFAAKDPLRVIPALVAGSALAGAISMTAGSALRVPHGGAFVLPIPNAVSNLGMYLVALAAGTVLSAVLLGVLKKPVTPPAATAAQ